MKKYILALCAISFLSFFSCKKDAEQIIPEDNSFRDPYYSGIRPEHHTRLDSCFSTGIDTLYLGNSFFKGVYYYAGIKPITFCVIKDSGVVTPKLTESFSVVADTCKLMQDGKEKTRIGWRLIK